MTLLQILKLVAVLGVLGVVFYLGGIGPRAKLETLRADQAAATAAAVLAQRLSYEASLAAKEKELDGLKTAALTQYPTTVVRLCLATSSVPATPQGGQVLPAAAGVGKSDAKPVPQGGPDYGPALFGLADAFDQVTAKCRND